MQASARAKKYWKIIEDFIPYISRNKSLEGIHRKSSRESWKLRIFSSRNIVEIPARNNWEIFKASAIITSTILFPIFTLKFMANVMVKSPLPFAHWTETFEDMVEKIGETMKKSSNDFLEESANTSNQNDTSDAVLEVILQRV